MVKSLAVESGQQVVERARRWPPTHSANLWLMKDLPAGFNVGGGVNYVGDHYANLAIPQRRRPTTTLRCRRQLPHPALDLQLNWNNHRPQIFRRRHGSNANLNLPGAPCKCRADRALRLLMQMPG